MPRQAGVGSRGPALQDREGADSDDATGPAGPRGSKAYGQHGARHAGAALRAREVQWMPGRADASEQTDSEPARTNGAVRCVRRRRRKRREVYVDPSTVFCTKRAARGLLAASAAPRLDVDQDVPFTW